MSQEALVTDFASVHAPQGEDGLAFYPLTAEGMPLPGPDFVEAAMALGDVSPRIIGKGDGKRMVEHGQYLSNLYKSALYRIDYSMQINVKGTKISPAFVPGHIWGGGRYGPAPARVLVLGKWPGQDEVNGGRNLVGPSGEILVQAITECGIPRDEYLQWYVTNLVKHPQLDPSSSRIPTGQVKNCMILLEQELRIVRPQFILAMGAEALEYLMGAKMSITMMTGRVLNRMIRVSDDHSYEAKVMACLHPAYVARDLIHYPEFKNTIGRFGEVISGRTSTEVMDDVDHRVVWTERDLAAMVDAILKEKDNRNIAIDCEWHGDYPTEPGAWLRSIQFSHKPGVGCAVVFRHKGGASAFLPSISAAIPHLKRLLLSTEGRDVRVIGHNIRADLPWITHGLDKEFGLQLIQQFAAAETPEETKEKGGFDTMLAGHSVNETGEYKLEVMCLNYCNIKRYDVGLLKWKAEECKRLKVADKDLEGYGECPDEIILGTPWDQPDYSEYKVGMRVKDSYSIWDVDGTQRLFRAFNYGGLLDKDVYGNSSRIPFWISQRASNGFLEMEMNGVMVDHKRAEELTRSFMQARDRLVGELQELLKWPHFNPSSSDQSVMALFGPQHFNKVDKKTGAKKDMRPEGAITLGLRPVKTTGKPSRDWHKIKQNEIQLYNPSTDKEVLGILCLRLFNKPGYEIVKTLRAARFIGQVLQSVLCRPTIDKTTKDIVLDDEGNWGFEKGLMSWVHKDSRVRTHLFQTKETGRASSARPPLQNISKRREKDYKKILMSMYKYPLRSILRATPGWVLFEADYKGAELLMMAIQAGDKAMIEHCMLANLPDGDPKQYDIHSNMAVNAFGLTVPDTKTKAGLSVPEGLWIPDLLKCGVGDKLPPTKLALEVCMVDNLRTAAKTLMFGIPYGRGDDAIVRSVEEEGVKITLEQARQLRGAIDNVYPYLNPYFEVCKERPYNPGWMRNCFGRMRRFPQVGGIDDGGAMAREAGNFPIQSGVADAISLAIHHLELWPDRQDRFRMILQIHDALLFEVKVDWIAELEKAINECMTKRVLVWPCDLDGRVHNNPTSYTMETDMSVMLNWGVKPTYEEGLEYGIPAHYCGKQKKAA